jgi:hypothetical protein
VTEDELWDHVESAIRDVVGIVKETSIPMHNSDILDKVQRSLPPDVYVSTETLEGMIRDYGSVDLDTVEPPEDSGA